MKLTQEYVDKKLAELWELVKLGRVTREEYEARRRLEVESLAIFGGRPIRRGPPGVIDAEYTVIQPKPR